MIFYLNQHYLSQFIFHPNALDSALPCLDVDITFNIIGISINAITASITITANNSINVNPFLFIYSPTFY